MDSYLPDGSTLTYPGEGGSFATGSSKIVDLTGGNLLGVRPERVAVAVEGQNAVIVQGDELITLAIDFQPIGVAAGDVDHDSVDEVIALGFPMRCALCAMGCLGTGHLPCRRVDSCRYSGSCRIPKLKSRVRPPCPAPVRSAAWLPELGRPRSMSTGRCCSPTRRRGWQRDGCSVVSRDAENAEQSVQGVAALYGARRFTVHGMRYNVHRSGEAGER